jgi:hypothetical protein
MEHFKSKGGAIADLSTEVIVTHPTQNLGFVRLDWHPQPGSYLELEGKAYTVLSRRHCYQFRAGKYQLHKISIDVQHATYRLEEKSLVDGTWVIGEASCRFNARTELLRCAVNPMGPCHNCRQYEPAPQPSLEA